MNELSYSCTIRPLPFFESRMEKMQAQQKLHPFQKRIIVKWFCASCENALIRDRRDEFVSKLFRHIENLGKSVTRRLRPQSADFFEKRVSLISYYSHSQLNEIYYCALRSFEEAFGQRNFCVMLFDIWYDKGWILASDVLQMQYCLSQALPDLLGDDREGSTMSSSDQVAKSVSLKNDEKLLFWLENRQQSMLQRSKQRIWFFLNHSLSKEETTLLIQISRVLSMMYACSPIEFRSDFIHHLHLYLYAYHHQSRCGEGRMQEALEKHRKKMDVIHYWLYRMSDTYIHLRQPFLAGLDSLVDKGALSISVANEIIEIFEKTKRCNWKVRFKKFKLKLVALSARSEFLFDEDLIRELFMATLI